MKILFIRSAWYLPLSICLFLSCHTSKKNRNEEIVRQWLGKEIIIPSNIEYKIMGRDTICPDLWDKPYKIFTYVDSAGCTSCQFGAIQWEQIITACKNAHIDVSFIFVIHSTNYEQFGYELLLNNFNYPIVYDKKNCFYELNHFLPYPYRTFLLDKENKVILIGSPTNNPDMLQLYMNIISTKKVQLINQ